MTEQPVDPKRQDADDGLQDSDVGPGTQSVDATVDSSSQDRPVTTQAVFRPNFDDDDSEATPLHIVIIVQIGTKPIGLLADRVLDIVSLDPSQIQPVPRIAQASRVEFLSGLVTIENAMIALIDLPNLLSVHIELDSVEAKSAVAAH